MLEQVLCLSNGDYKQSTMLRLPQGCVDRAAESITASVLIREQPMNSQDKQTLSLRAVCPIAYGGVWAIIDDGCNSCCHGEVWRRKAEVKMKVLGLHPSWLHRKATTFNGVGTSTTNQKPNIPMGVTLCAVSLFWSRVPLFDDLLSLTRSKQTCFPRIFPFPSGRSWSAMDVSHLVHAHLFGLR